MVMQSLLHPKTYVFENTDANDDDKVDAADIVKMINTIKGI